MSDVPSEPAPPATGDVEGLGGLVDLARLAAWMDGQGLGSGPITGVERLGGGTQNVLVRFERVGRRYVFRRPPEHKRRNSDETMRREARVLGALAGSDVPHPALIAACPDEEVLGAAFYLMEPVEGFNPGVRLPGAYRDDASLRHGMGLAMADGIAALARIDYRQVGLEGFGRPDGYLERQVERWRGQLDSYFDLDGYPGPDIPGLDEVAAWLDANLPAGSPPGIIHGDCHLGNVLFDPHEARLTALVDWELSTVGDPLVDLGQLLATWPDPDDELPLFAMDPLQGITPPADIVARYAAGSDRDLSALAWYEVLACYRLGIILEGTHARAAAGMASKETGDVLHAVGLALFARARKRVASA